MKTTAKTLALTGILIKSLIQRVVAKAIKLTVLKPVNAWLILAASCLLGTTVAHASTLIVVDVSNPSAVVFSATSNTPLLNALDQSREGVTLLDFFGGGHSVSGFAFAMGSSLRPTFQGDTYNAILNSSGGLTNKDLNIYASFSDTVQRFATTSSAFTGSAVANFSGAPLPSSGTFGSILTGDRSSPSGVIIGQYAVVPEPSTILLMIGGMATIAFLRKRGK